MRIDILSHYKAKDVFVSLPTLRQFHSFVEYNKSPTKGLPPNMVIAYVVLLYSEDSVLNKQPMPALEQRQIMAAELAGFKPKKGKHDNVVVNGLFNLENEGIFSMAFEYLMFQKQAEWQLLIATETLRVSYLRDMMKPTHNTKELEAKSKLKSLVKTYNDDIAEQIREIFSDHKKLEDFGKEKLWGDTIETII